MKRRYSLMVVAALCVLILSGCLPTTTKSSKPKSYSYGLNEPIVILDNKSEKEVGTIAITGFEILLDNTFEAVFDDGRDEAGNPKTKTITYSQIIQVFYTYKADIPIGYGNFLIYDEDHVTATGIDYINPRPDFSEKTDKKDNYFIVCLKNKSQKIDIDVRFHSYDATPVAKVRISLEADALSTIHKKDSVFYL